jgi:sulfur-carrier protein
MATVWIPSLMRDLTERISEVEVSGETLREVIDGLEARFPGMRERLCDGEAIRPNIAVVIDGSTRTRQGLRQRVEQTSEVHFVPAVSGGREESGD